MAGGLLFRSCLFGHLFKGTGAILTYLVVQGRDFQTVGVPLSGRVVTWSNSDLLSVCVLLDIIAW